MGTSSQLASIDEMESLWFELQREMTESGKISRYPGTITRLSGDKDNTDIVRVGSFALLGDGGLQWNVDTQTITEIARQPTGRHTSTAEEMQDAQPGEIINSLLIQLAARFCTGNSIGNPWREIGSHWVGSVVLLHSVTAGAV